MKNNLQHLAIIMDGNGRWAESHNLPRVSGHQHGADTAKKIITASINHKIKHLTLYTFSSENWQRPQEEVDALMNLFVLYLDNELAEMHTNCIKIKFIGNLSILNNEIKQKILNAENLTKDNNTLQLNIALSYGSREEITHAMQKIGTEIAYNKLKPSEITEKLITDNLYTQNTPDPDMLIRTGGEHRISNYLLWQCAYTELYFSDVLWPDFNADELKIAIDNFNNRERRFGKI